MNRFLLILCLFISACKSNDPIEDEEPEDTIQVYNFTQPQFVATQDFVSPRTNGFKQRSCIKENVFLHAITSSPSNYPLSGGLYEVHLNWRLNINNNNNMVSGVISSAQFSVNHGGNPIYCYDINSSGTILYVVINESLFRAELKNPLSAIQFSKVATGIGVSSFIKVISDAEVVVATDLQNGSIIKINQNGTKQVIATNLGNPTAIDLFKNEYYVSVNSSAGSVKKVSQSGAISTVLSNINFPSSICFDRNGNFVLQENFTNQGGTYIIYKLYTPDGEFIESVADHNEVLIVSGISTLSTPLFIDQYNSLYFSHTVTSNGAGITNCNPNTVNWGIWKVQMNKQ